LTIGVVAVIGLFSFALLQHPGETVDKQGVQSVSASQSIFHEGKVDEGSISALVSKTKILEVSPEQQLMKKPFDVLGGAVPLGFLDGDAVLGKTTLDEAEIAFQKFRERAKDR
jgi:hypothetical protein